MTHERDALLVEKRDVSALAAALSRVLENRQLHESLKWAGRESVLRHTNEAYYRAIAGIFQEALGG